MNLLEALAVGYVGTEPAPRKARAIDEVNGEALSRLNHPAGKRIKQLAATSESLDTLDDLIAWVAEREEVQAELRERQEARDRTRLAERHAFLADSKNWQD